MDTNFPSPEVAKPPPEGDILVVLANINIYQVGVRTG